MEKTESKVKCAICGEMFPIITPSHLKKHHTSLSDYKEKFPDSPITSSQYKAKQKFLKGSLFTKEEKTPIIDEIDLGDLSLKTEAKIDMEIEEVKNLSEPSLLKSENKDLIVRQLEIKESGSKPQPRPQIQIIPEKRRVLELLQNLFPVTSVVNNYLVEKFHRDGTLEYQYVTDIAIPSKNIDLEFPKCFWHNTQRLDPYRKHKLERDGWTIVEIREPSPSADIIKSYLRNRKLI